MSLKRFFDIVVSFCSIVPAAPLFLIIAIVIKLESRGPVIYRCARVGLNGTLFKMFKFRTMVDIADKVDCKLCAGPDVRVTASGRFLRRTKLNELPQLLNVLAGEMSLVGPRPEDPKFIEVYRDKWKIVLSVPPGIFGLNQVAHRNEEDIFPPDEDPERFYIRSILPHKLDRDIEYVRNHTFWGDIKLIGKGVAVTLAKGRVGSLFGGGRLSLLELLGDLALSLAAYLLAHLIRFESFPASVTLLQSGAFIVAINGFFFSIMGLYRRSSRFFSVPDVFFIAKVSLISAACFIATNRLLIPLGEHSRAVFILYPFILFGLLGGVRLCRRIAEERAGNRRSAEQPVKKTLIYGAGRLGVETARQLQFEQDAEIVGFVDDHPRLRGTSILGFKVLGAGSDLHFLKDLYDIERIVIAFRSRQPGLIDEARRRCHDAGAPEVLVTSVPPPTSERPPVCRTSLRNLRISDELGIPQIPLFETASNMIKESTVAIIGGGDGVSEHFCREMRRLDIRKTIVVDNCPARLRLLQDRLHMDTRPVERVELAYQPWGLHGEIRKLLRAHEVNWIVCHHLFRPASSPSAGFPSLLVADFIELVRLIRAAVILGCRGFTLVSPVHSDAFSKEQKALHLLCEQYTAFAAVTSMSDLKTAVVRVPNILEDDNGMVQRARRLLTRNPFAALPARPMSFSSCRYAARTILNCLPLHDRGPTYALTASLITDLKRLVDQYEAVFSRGSGLNARTAPRPAKCDSSSRGPNRAPIGNDTSLNHVQMITDPERPEIERWEHEIALLWPYLDAPERNDIAAFFEYMRYSAAFLAQPAASG